MSAFHADLKSFSLGMFPYDAPVLEAGGAWPSDPVGQAILDARGKFDPKIGDHWQFAIHHEVSALIGDSIQLGAGSTGVAGGAPELVGLSWSAAGSGNLAIHGRTDRLSARLDVGPIALTAGRQAVSFGTGTMFTPLDLVSPFFPATIDTEYKPGVDALRVDAYSGTSVHEQAVGAWVGDCAALTTDANARCHQVGVGDLAAASWTQVTVGVTDVGVFVGEVHDDEVFGGTVATSAGPVALHSDVAITLPPGHLDARTPTEDAFVRAVAGATALPTDKTSLSGEVYVQTNGARDPANYLIVAQGDRWQRGELWALGRVYAGVAVSQELRPTLSASVAVIANLEDPSALVVPGFSASVAQNVDLSAGAYLGVGKRPQGVALRSELGTVPTTGYLRIAAYF